MVPHVQRCLCISEGEQWEEGSSRRGRGALFEDDVDDEKEAFEPLTHDDYADVRHTASAKPMHTRRC